MSLEKIVDYFDKWIVESYRLPAEPLALYRISYVLLSLIFKGTPSFTWLATIPDFFYNPPMFSLASLFSGFPPLFFLQGLNFAIALLYICLLFGYRTKAVGISLSLLLLLGNSFTYTFGKINHDELFAMIVPFVMSFSNWGAAYSLDAIQKRAKGPIPGWPITMVALLLGFAMFTAGFPKLLVGWLDPSTAAVRGYLFRRFYVLESQYYLAPLFIQVNNVVFWELLDYGAVIFEIGFLVAVFRRQILRIFIIMATFFHLANLLIINISFAANLFIYLLFIDWEPVVRFVTNTRLKIFLRVFENRIAFLFSLLGITTFNLYRAAVNPNITENALRESVAPEATEPIISLFDIVQHFLGIQINISLLLLIASVLVATVYIIAFARTRYAKAAKWPAMVKS